MNKSLLCGIIFAALSTYTSGTSTASEAPLGTEINLTFTTTQEGRPQEKENVRVNLSFVDNYLTKVGVLINSDAKLEEKTAQFLSPSAHNNTLATLIFDKLRTEILAPPLDLLKLFDLIKTVVNNFEEEDDQPQAAQSKKKEEKPNKGKHPKSASRKKKAENPKDAKQK